MKIAYIVEAFGVVSETFIADLARGLADRGNNVRMFVDTSSQSPAGAAISIVPVGYISGGFRLGVWVRRLAPIIGCRAQRVARRLEGFIAARRLGPALAAFRPDVAYMDHGTNAVLARRALEEAHIPYVVHFHGYDASVLFAQPDYVEEVRRVVAGTAAVLVPSQHLRRRLVLAGCDEGRIQVIPNGVKLSAVQPVDWATRRRTTPSVIFVGRLVEKKNPLALLHAFHLVRQTIRNARLTIVGDGPLRTALEQRIHHLGLAGAVDLRGALPHHVALAELANHWVFAQHSVTATNGDQESFGISLAEAAASGLPVVSTMHGGIPEHVVHGQTGFLVPEFDYESMARAIIKLLRDSALAEQMGLAGRRHVLQQFPLDTRIERVERILANAASRHGYARQTDVKVPCAATGPAICGVQS